MADSRMEPFFFFRCLHVRPWHEILVIKNPGLRTWQLGKNVTVYSQLGILYGGWVTDLSSCRHVQKAKTKGLSSTETGSGGSLLFISLNLLSFLRTV